MNYPLVDNSCYFKTAECHMEWNTYPDHFSFIQIHSRALQTEIQVAGVQLLNGQTILGKYIDFILLAILYIITSDLTCTVLLNFLFLSKWNSAQCYGCFITTISNPFRKHT